MTTSSDMHHKFTDIADKIVCNGLSAGMAVIGLIALGIVLYSLIPR